MVVMDNKVNIVIQHMNATLPSILGVKPRCCRIETEVSNIQQPPTFIPSIFSHFQAASFPHHHAQQLGNLFHLY